MEGEAGTVEHEDAAKATVGRHRRRLGVFQGAVQAERLAVGVPALRGDGVVVADERREEEQHGTGGRRGQ